MGEWTDMRGKELIIGGTSLAVWLLAAPFVVYDAMLAPNFWNDILVGVVVAALALYGVVCTWRDRQVGIAAGGLLALLGLWQVTRPFAVATAGPIPKWGDAVVGVLLAFLGGRVVREARTAALERRSRSDVGGSGQS
ncbi:hypothetical protein [Haladaptatus sp. T7]|uniref:SPW repeat domain-containing protein n=1 Tax=Haladaptatus sp. T7 TaxID=2029368 RepID=UPI0021A2530F|nr:hypothetical protein [Haladaptatus sp. T7]GKZ15860.1 hypothetical protein HAL_37410 [Haladaptatus sp. T7]